MAIAPPESHDTPLKQLLESVDSGALQLPEFQRGWTWDDDRIRNIIASLSQGYPMGALMQLECGGDVKLKYRPFEGTDIKDVNASFLVLDGQQRLTSLYRSLFSKKVVTTVDARKQPLERYYYLDIRKCLDHDEDRLDAIVSVPKSRIVTKDIGREVVLDLSSLDRELEELCFPANKIFDEYDWLMPFIEHYRTQSEEFQLWKEFKSNVLDTMTGYVLPVIKLGKETPREAVCKVFENVNTGGVSLTVFELVTASFATYDFDLRGNWDNVVRPRIWGEELDIVTDVMRGIDATAFLTSMTLYSTFLAKKILDKGHTSCKKKDVLDLKLEDYQSNLVDLLEGFDMAREFLRGERIFRKRDLPYTTQVIPLAATCAYIGRDKFKLQANKNILRQWLWCGIFGEMYGGANETRYANDIEDLVDAIEGNPSPMRTVNASYFQSIRLLGLQTRNSAAYKGVMALVFREDCRDFIDGEQMTMVKTMMTPPDIHHIFPQAYCQKMGLDKGKWNSIVNKTPLIYTTNRTIGGVAPSKYLPRVLKEGQIDEAELRVRIESHLIDFDALAADDFDTYFIDRAKKLLNAIERAMGKAVPDRGSEETIKRFGEALV
jgi:hypothetical protein